VAQRTQTRTAHLTPLRPQMAQKMSRQDVRTGRNNVTQQKHRCDHKRHDEHESTGAGRVEAG
jgi:hypothetical protein